MRHINSCETPLPSNASVMHMRHIPVEHLYLLMPVLRHIPEPPSIHFCLRVRNNHGISSVICAKFMAYSYGKTAINFPKIARNAHHAVKSELSHGHFKFSWNDEEKNSKRGSLY